MYQTIFFKDLTTSFLLKGDVVKSLMKVSNLLQQSMQMQSSLVEYQ